MGSIFHRGRKLWMKYKAADGRWTNAPTSLDVGQEKAARKLLEKVEERIASGLAPADGPITVREYARRWVERRKADGLSSATINGHQLAHLMPMLGDLAVEAVTTADVIASMKRLRVEGKRRRGEGALAPRTIRHSYFTLEAMFEAAREDDHLVEANPCRIRREKLARILPPNVDKDPLWRRHARLTRDELEMLIVHPTIPLFRRVWYALEGLGALRFGEVSALVWRTWDPHAHPLGRLDIVGAYDSNNRRAKGVKTDNPRAMPVHPVLAKLLAEWRLTGWRELVGRVPGPDDLVLPVLREGRWTHREKLDGWLEQNADFEALGWRHRRQHDLRRTFVTLARSDGARPDLLRWCTHGPPRGSTIDDYTSPPWETICEQVSCLRIVYREGVVIQLPVAAQAGRPADDLGTAMVQSERNDSDYGEVVGWGTRGSNPVTSSHA